MIVSEEGVVIRTPVEDVSQLGRSTQGVRVMNVADSDRVTAVAIAADSSKSAREEAADAGAGPIRNQTSLMSAEAADADDDELAGAETD